MMRLDYTLQNHRFPGRILSLALTAIFSLALPTLPTLTTAANHTIEDVRAAASKLPQEMVSWATTVLINGHIVTMDDRSISANPGTIVEAMAIRDGFIMKVGSNEDVKLLVGPETRVMDLQGRTVLPGLIDTHAHPGPSTPR
jgi:adenine deaminase